jgi:hypothetical protein
MTDKKPSHEEDSCETASDDPRQKTDWPNTKQTDEPVLKEKRNESDIDLENGSGPVHIKSDSSVPMFLGSLVSILTWTRSTKMPRRAVFG